MANRTFRVYYSEPMHGRNRKNFQIPNVDTTSVAFVSAAEYLPEVVPPNHPDERRRHLGEAIEVSNVSVHGDDGTPNSGVEFLVHVNAIFTLFAFVVVDITILDSVLDITHV